MLTVVPGCGAIRDGADDVPRETATTGPPPGASQAPGPPLATASAPSASAVDPTDPASVAADCFARWQSYDATVDPGPDAGVERARDCLTADFFAQLEGSAGEGAEEQARLWEQLRASETKSVVEVLATTPLDGVDTTASGRVALVLNVRRTTTAVGTAPETAVSTPALSLLRQADGSWRVAGADLSVAAGDAPGG